MIKRTHPLRSMRWIGFGGLTGMLILGFAGRFVMAGLAIGLGYRTILSVVGMVLVIVLGGVLGAIGGLFVHLLALWGMERGRGVLASVVLFFVSTLLLKPPDAPDQAADADALVSVMWLIPKSSLEGELFSIRLLTIGLVAILFLIYGLLLDHFLRGPAARPPAKK